MTEGDAGQTVVTIPVTLSEPAGSPVPLAYETRPGSATPGEDYVASSGSVTIPAGATAAQITATIFGDEVAEGEEYLFVAAEVTGGAGFAVTNSGYAIISDDDPAALTTVTIDHGPTVSEGDEGITPAVFNLHISPPPTSPLTLPFEVHEGSAEAGLDYLVSGGTLTFAAGEEDASIEIPVAGDLLAEADETFQIRLEGSAQISLEGPFLPVQSLDIATENVRVVADGQTVAGGDYAGDTGVVRIVERDPATALWAETAVLRPTEAEDDDQFGRRLDIEGPMLIAGAQYTSGVGTRVDGTTYNVIRAGAAYIYHRDAGQWTEVAKLAPPDPVRGQYFGSAVAISGDTAAVGSNLDDDQGRDAGSVYVFRNGPDGWGEAVELFGSDISAGNQFGRAVALHGDLLAVGAWRHQHLAGAVYLFESQPDGSWIEVAKLTAPDGQPGDLFGIELATDGEWVAVGAHFVDTGQGENAGAVYLFHRSLGPGGSWGFASKITSDAASRSSRFGYTVDIEGDRVIAGYLGQTGAEIYERQAGSLTDWHLHSHLKGTISSRYAALGDGYAALGSQSRHISVYGPGGATATILNDDGEGLGIVGDDVLIAEGDEGTTIATVTLRRNFAEFPASVRYTLVGGTALPGEDFVAATGTATFLLGSLTTTFDVGIIGDLDAEYDEEFHILFSDPTGSPLTAERSTVRISNDDDIPNKAYLVRLDAPIRVHVPRFGVPGDWISTTFDDSEWRRGFSGVGYERSSSSFYNYGAYIGTNVGSAMYGPSFGNTDDIGNANALIRYPFEVSNLDEFLDLSMRIQYDDGFAAFLNGVPIASRNAPETLYARSKATANRSDADAVTFEELDLSAHLPELRVGANVLAVHGLNDDPESSDFLIRPELIASLPSRIPHTAFGRPAGVSTPTG